MTLFSALLGIGTILCCGAVMYTIRSGSAHRGLYATATGLLGAIFFLTIPGFHPAAILLSVLAAVTGATSLLFHETHERKTADDQENSPIRRVYPAQRYLSDSGHWRLRRPEEYLSESGVWRIK